MVAAELGFASTPSCAPRRVGGGYRPHRLAHRADRAGPRRRPAFEWEGLVDGEPVITAAVNWLMGEEHLDPPWRFGPR